MPSTISISWFLILIRWIKEKANFPCFLCQSTYNPPPKISKLKVWRFPRHVPQVNNSAKFSQFFSKFPQIFLSFCKFSLMCRCQFSSFHKFFSKFSQILFKVSTNFLQHFHKFSWLFNNFPLKLLTIFFRDFHKFLSTFSPKCPQILFKIFINLLQNFHNFSQKCPQIFFKIFTNFTQDFHNFSPKFSTNLMITRIPTRDPNVPIFSFASLFPSHSFHARRSKKLPEFTSREIMKLCNFEGAVSSRQKNTIEKKTRKLIARASTEPHQHFAPSSNFIFAKTQLPKKKFRYRKIGRSESRPRGQIAPPVSYRVSAKFGCPKFFSFSRPKIEGMAS